MLEYVKLLSAFANRTIPASYDQRPKICLLTSIAYLKVALFVA